MKILVTGCAGFIGFHVCNKLISEKHDVVGIDNLNPYYDIRLKNMRLKELEGKIEFHKIDICDYYAVKKLFSENRFDVVIHLAALPGVSNSIENPLSYIMTNIDGFSNILEMCRQNECVQRLLFASSSSVYGNNVLESMKEDMVADYPESVYAATKRVDEILAYTYSQLYGIKTSALRFFTVYGEYGRPDMAYWKFTENLIKNEPIILYNYGDIYRDFTYVGDLAERVYQIMEDENGMLYNVFNIGGGASIKLTELINGLFDKMIELGIIKMRENVAVKLTSFKKGDVLRTEADLTKIENYYGRLNPTPLDEGLEKFLRWYKLYIIDSEFNLKGEFNLKE